MNKNERIIIIILMIIVCVLVGLGDSLPNKIPTISNIFVGLLFGHVLYNLIKSSIEK